MEDFRKYAKIVLYSTLAEQRTLVGISIDWFQNKGRLYQPFIMKEIRTALKDRVLIQKKKFYRANTHMFILYALEQICLGEDNALIKEYRKILERFYFEMGEYTQKVYLNFEIIKLLTKMDMKKADNLNIPFLVQLPFFLRYIEHKDKELANIFIQIMSLEEYVKTIEKLEIQYYPLLKEKGMTKPWMKTFDAVNHLYPQMQKKGLAVFSKNVAAMKALLG